MMARSIIPLRSSRAIEAIKLPFSAPAAGLLPDDTAKFSAFVADYLEHGDGAISITAPSGPSSGAAIGYFAERLASLGVPRGRIMVGSRDAQNGDTRVEIGYIGYSAHTDPCGDWSTSVADTASNLSTPNFGCAVQHNIAAMVADPRDLVAPRAERSKRCVAPRHGAGQIRKGPSDGRRQDRRTSRAKCRISAIDRGA